MYIHNASALAQNDVSVSILLQSNRGDWAAVQLGAAGAAGQQFELHATWNGVDWYTTKMTDPADPTGAVLASLTGQNKVGYARVAGAIGVRVKRLDNGVASDVGLVLTETPRMN